MAIPVATTTISVLRTSPVDESGRDPFGEGYETPSDTSETFAPISTKVRAVISRGGQASGGPGDTETSDFVVQCDPTDLTFRDQVKDESTGEVYDVEWAYTTPGIAGLGNTLAGLSQVRGPGRN